MKEYNTTLMIGKIGRLKISQNRVKLKKVTRANNAHLAH